MKLDTKTKTEPIFSDFLWKMCENPLLLNFSVCGETLISKLNKSLHLHDPYCDDFFEATMEKSQNIASVPKNYTNNFSEVFDHSYPTSYSDSTILTERVKALVYSQKLFNLMSLLSILKVSGHGCSKKTAGGSKNFFFAKMLRKV